jgi:predicted glutamine amidotransferase
MCGIVGFVSTKGLGASTSDVKAFYNLLLADTARGADGTGMYWQDDKGKMWYYKDVGPASSVVTRGDVEKFLDDARFAVGHNRAATLGAVDKDTTHPFTYEHVIGVHNGTVAGWKSLGAKEATMDSMAIFELLNEVDDDDTSITDFLAKLGSGAYSLVWHDKRSDVLRFARNSQRPMCMVLAKNGDLWFGSERRMLEWALDRNSIKMDKSWSLDTNCLFTLPLDGKAAPSAYHYTPEYTSTYTSGYASGRTWPMYGGGYDDTFEDAWFTPTQAAVNRHYSPSTVTAPRKVMVSGDLSSVDRELPFNLSARSKLEISKTLRIMLGLKPGQVMSRTAGHYLDQYLSESVEGATSDRGTVRCPVEVCAVHDNSMLGFMVVDGAYVPVILTGHCTPDVKAKIMKIIDDGYSAKCPGVMVYGLNLYHHADIAYRAGPAVCGADAVSEGRRLNVTDSTSLKSFFGTSHPDAACLLGDPDWEMWGRMQGGLL